jgi:hypothetical protein
MGDPRAGAERRTCASRSACRERDELRSARVRGELEPGARHRGRRPSRGLRGCEQEIQPKKRHGTSAGWLWLGEWRSARRNRARRQGSRPANRERRRGCSMAESRACWLAGIHARGHRGTGAGQHVEGTSARRKLDAGESTARREMELNLEKGGTCSEAARLGVGHGRGRAGSSGEQSPGEGTTAASA